MKKTYIKPVSEIVNVSVQQPIAVSFDEDGNGWADVQDDCNGDVIQALSRTMMVTF